MKIGSLGDIIFKVSDKVVETFNGFERSGSAAIQTHAVHNGRALAEFTGVGNEKISFQLTLSAYLGVSPRTELSKLIRHCRSGKILKLVLGRKVVGAYRWVISSWKAEYETFFGNGQVSQIVVSVTLQEYLKQPKSKKKKASTVKKSTKDTSTTKKSTTAATSTTTKKIGTTVQFKGGYQYVNSEAKNHAGKCAAGPARITAIAKNAKHPYHLIHTDKKSTVYGWVDASSIS